MNDHLKQCSSFLGHTSYRKEIAHCLFEITTYGARPEYEDWHSHHNTSLSFLLSGTHHEELNGHQYCRIPGDTKIVYSGVSHRCTGYAPGARKINLELTKDCLVTLGIKEFHLDQLESDPQRVKFTLLKLYAELQTEDIYGSAPAELLIYELFCSDKTRYEMRARPPKWARQLLVILNDQWNEAFELKYFAGQLGVHPVTISRYFPKYFGQTLGQYLNRLRIERSLPLIKSSKLSLTAVAYKCGFSDQAHFTRVFQAATGVLPSRFRGML